MPRFFNKLSKLWIRPGKSKTNIGRETELGHGQGVGGGKNVLWNVKGMLKLFDNENLEPTVFLEMSNNEKVWRHIHHQRQDKVKWTNRGNIKRKKTFKSWKWKNTKLQDKVFFKIPFMLLRTSQEAIVSKQLYLFNKVKTVSSFVRALDVFPANWSNKDFLLSVSLHFSFCLLALCKHLIKRKGTSLSSQQLRNYKTFEIQKCFISVSILVIKDVTLLLFPE